MKKNKLNLTWVEIFDSYKNKYNLTKQEYLTILKLSNSLFMEAIIDTGYFIRVPHRMGRLLIQKSKPTLRPIDLAYYMATGEKVYHNNRHSHGYMAKFKWDKSNRQAVLKDRALFEFAPVRANKRKLAKAIKEKNTILKYMEHDNTLYNN